MCRIISTWEGAYPGIREQVPDVRHLESIRSLRVVRARGSKYQPDEPRRSQSDGNKDEP
jgi:hypothetical protein